MNFTKFFEMDKKLMVKVIAGVVLLAVAFAFYLVKERGADRAAAVSVVSGSEERNAVQTTDAGIKEETVIVVDVAGAVKTPAVVELSDGSRIVDAVKKAGGFTAEADTRAVNQAEKLSDGQKIYIPTRKETEESQGGGANYASTGSGGSYHTGSGTSGVSSSGQSKININTADSSALQQLTGVGPATAEKIISYRNENGRFKTIEDIKNVSGIGDKTFEKFKDKITI